MSMQVYKAKVAEHQLLSGSFQYLHLELLQPHRIEFQAGQYAIVTIDPKKGIKRNYSIASLPSMDHAIELLVDVKPGGDGSRYLANLKPGDEVEFAGPFGSFVVDNSASLEARGAKQDNELPATTHELLFVATGSGISAVRSMILDQLITRKFPGKIRLWWGMRYAQDCFWIEDFDELEEENPNFEWDLILSKAPDDWPLHAGHVTPHVLTYVRTQNSKLKTQNDMSFYLCGNRFMIEEVSTELVKLGITAERIHSEKFF